VLRPTYTDPKARKTMSACTKTHLIPLYVLVHGIIHCFTSNNGATSFQFQLPSSALKGHRGGGRLHNNLDGVGLMRYPLLKREDVRSEKKSRTRISPSAVCLEKNDNEVTSSEVAQRTLLPSEFENNDNSGLPKPVSQGGIKKSDMVLLASYSSSVALISLGLQSVLLQFEWAQDWRYFWPLIGILYIWDGLTVLSNGKGMQDLPKSKLSIKSPSSSVLLPGLPPLWSGRLGLISGVGLLIGGASDAFLPVWMTGPNLISSAGVSQDSATFLLILTAISTFRQFGSDLILDPTLRSARPNLFGEWTFWANSLLMAQLYILGAGSIDEIWAVLQDITP